MTNPFPALAEAGQAIWLDFLHRRILEDGELKRQVAEEGVRGVTSNPAIFEQAIGKGDAYDARLARLIAERDGDVVDLYERLAIADAAEICQVQHRRGKLRPRDRGGNFAATSGGKQDNSGENDFSQSGCAEVFKRSHGLKF